LHLPPEGRAATQVMEVRGEREKEERERERAINKKYKH
jgi:hypothetical protein